MKLIILRHATCLGLDKSIINGWEDFTLTDDGIKEAISTGKILKNKIDNIDIAYSSYLKRTNMTAKLILKSFGQDKVIQDLRLNERHYGAFQLMDRKEARRFKEYNSLSDSYRRLDNRLIELDDERYEKQIKEYMKKMNKTREQVLPLMPRSESILDTEKRTLDFLNEILVKENQDKTILIVTHANQIKLLTKNIEKLTYKDASNLRFATCGMKIYDLKYIEKNNKYKLINIENINKEWTC